MSTHQYDFPALQLVYRASATRMYCKRRLGYKSLPCWCAAFYSEEENWKPLIFGKSWSAELFISALDQLSGGQKYMCWYCKCALVQIPC